MERRKQQRRVSPRTPVFPILTVYGRIIDDRRKQADRRLNDIRTLILEVIEGQRIN